MKNLSSTSLHATRKKLLPVIMSSLIVLVASINIESAEAQTEGNTPVSDSSLELENVATQSASDSLPPDYDSYIIMQGKGVYQQLLTAREGSLSKDKAKMMAGLDLAKKAIEQLQLPSQLLALDKQLGVIKDDLNDKSSKLDGDLWVPVEAQLQAAMAFSSDEIVAPVLTKARQGQQAARENDHKKASELFNELVLASQYNLGIFPLTKVSQDINSAIASANSGPYWAGANEAIQSALASFHWYSKVPSHGLLSAYTDILNAYSMSLAPQVTPDQAQLVINQLVKAVKELEKVPETGGLQQQAQKLIDSVTPSFIDIKMLLEDVHDKIQMQQQQEQEQFYKSVGNDPVEMG